MSWLDGDPRESIGKRAKIIVVDKAVQEAFFGEVETKHGWSVTLRGRGPDDRKYVREDELWPATWVWSFAP